MALAHTIEFATLDELHFDPMNPRLGRANSGPNVTQTRLLEIMRSWALEELAVSFIESGFWPQEAVIVVKEPLYGPPDKLVVVEGNRRIAALRYLRDAIGGNPASRMWKQLADSATLPPDLFTKIPYILADVREDVIGFLGFRHVTGIKEWEPAQKAEYIAHMIDDLGMSYEEVRRRIGSRTETVRRNYISYRVYKQLEGIEDKISIEKVEQRFSILFLSLREAKVQNFLDVDIRAEPESARIPVPESKLDDLAYFIVWLYGTEERKPLFTDSRYVGDFAQILGNPEAVAYLKSSPEPSFDLALQKAGVEEAELVRYIQEATDYLELALGRIHLHLDSPELQKAVRRFALGVRELLQKFPSLGADLSIVDKGDSDDA